MNAETIDSPPEDSHEYKQKALRQLVADHYVAAWEVMKLQGMLAEHLAGAVISGREDILRSRLKFLGHESITRQEKITKLLEVGAEWDVRYCRVFPDAQATYKLLCL